MSRPRSAFITGISGQDGSYLAELLVEQGYKVYGMVTGDPAEPLPRLAAVQDAVELVRGDLADHRETVATIVQTGADEIYNLAAPTFVPASWSQPEQITGILTVSVAAMLAGVQQRLPESRFLQAGSSEIFGDAPTSPQNEETAMRPRSPYGVGKLFGLSLVRAYRRQFGMHASCAILYNHESPRRGEQFVTRKITSTAAKIKLGLADELVLGNLDDRRDWGFAGDYVRAMWAMQQQGHGDDYVIATGQTHSVRELVEIAFGRLGLDPDSYVRTDPAFVRPPDAVALVGDPAKAKRTLSWSPTVSFETLITEMVDADMAALTNSVV